MAFSFSFGGDDDDDQIRTKESVALKEGHSGGPTAPVKEHSLEELVGKTRNDLSLAQTAHRASC
jgi:hypothetical protein